MALSSRIIFELNEVVETQKVAVAAVHLQGAAIIWYRWIRQSLGVLSWQQFSRAICTCFGSRNLIDPCSSLAKLTQTSTAGEYISSFEKLVNRAPGLSEPHHISMFLSGLRGDIQVGVRLLNPISLTHAFELTLSQEDAILANLAYSSSKALVRPSSRNVSAQTSSTQRSTSSLPMLPPGVKRHTWADQKERRAKGFCFNSDEHYQVMFVQCHNFCCYMEQLMKVNLPVEENTTELPELTPLFAISLLALLGSTFPKTMRLKGSLKHQSVTVLIDSGSTHNFIHPSVAKRCGFSPPKNQHFTVRIADGGQLTSYGCSKGVSLNLQGYEFITDLFLLDISGCDVVLGAQWLRTLGLIAWDFTQLVMQFSVADCVYSLVGDNSPMVMFMDSKMMTRTLKQERQGILFHLTIATEPISSLVSVDVVRLLSEFANIFA